MWEKWSKHSFSLPLFRPKRVFLVSFGRLSRIEQAVHVAGHATSPRGGRRRIQVSGAGEFPSSATAATSNEGPVALSAKSTRRGVGACGQRRRGPLRKAPHPPLTADGMMAIDAEGIRVELVSHILVFGVGHWSLHRR